MAHRLAKLVFGLTLGGAALLPLAQTGMAAGIELDETGIGGVTDHSLAGNYLAGLHAASLGDAAAGAAFTARALAYDPENPGLLTRLMRFALYDGQVGAAARAAERLIMLGDDAPMTVITVAANLAKKGKYQAALDQIAPLRELSDRQLAFVTPLLSGWLNVGIGDIEGARAEFASLQSIQGAEALGKLHMALFHDHLGETEAAWRLYEELAQMERGGEARIAMAQISLRLRAGDKADAARIAAEFDNARRSGVRMTTWLDNPRAQASLVPDAETGLAFVLFDTATALRPADRNVRSDLAVIFARLSLHLAPQLGMVRIYAAELYESEERPAMALEMYEGVEETSPFILPATLRGASLLGDLEGPEAAIELLEGMIEAQPERADLHFTLADILRRDKRYDEAVAAYDAAFDRLDEGAATWNLHYARGIALERAGIWDRAERDFQIALSMQPEQALVLNYLGYSWADQNINLDHARKLIEKAVELRPESGFIVDSLAWVLYRQGDYEGAVRELERAVELEPADPTVTEHLGDAYWRVGRKREARYQWRRALLFDPEPEQAAKIEAKLERGLEESE